MAKRDKSVKGKKFLSRRRTATLIEKARSGSKAAYKTLAAEYERLASMANKRIARIRKAGLEDFGSQRIESYLSYLGRSKFSESRNLPLDEMEQSLKELQLFREQKNSTLAGARKAYEYRKSMYAEMLTEAGRDYTKENLEKLTHYMGTDSAKDYLGEHYGTTDEIIESVFGAFDRGVSEADVDRLFAKANANKILYNEVVRTLDSL